MTISQYLWLQHTVQTLFTKARLENFQLKATTPIPEGSTRSDKNICCICKRFNFVQRVTKKALTNLQIVLNRMETNIATEEMTIMRRIIIELSIECKRLAAEQTGRHPDSKYQYHRDIKLVIIAPISNVSRKIVPLNETMKYLFYWGHLFNNVHRTVK